MDRIFNVKSEPTEPLLAQIGSTGGLGIAPGKDVT